MSQINRYPETLLNLLDMKSSGVTPRALQGVVSPTLDVGEMYAVKLITAENSNGTITAVGSTVTLTIGNGQHWLIRNVSGVVNYTAIGQKVDTAIDIVRPDNAVSVTVANHQGFQAQASGDSARYGVGFGAGLLLSPGWTVRLRCTGLSGGSPTFAVQALFHRFTG